MCVYVRSFTCVRFDVCYMCVVVLMYGELY